MQFFHQFKNFGAILFAKSHDLGAASLSLVRQPLSKKDKNSPDVAVLNSTPQVNKKPNYKEMREFYCKAVGIDDAVLVDDFDRECRMANDYSNWKQRLLKYRGDIGC